MSVAALPNLLVVDSRSASVGQRIGSMVAVSLALHCLILFLTVGLRLPAKVERPLSSYEVSLIAMPTVQRVEAPHITSANESLPMPRAIPPVPSSPLKKIELPQEKAVSAPVVPKHPLLRAKEPLPTPVPIVQAAPVKTPESKSIPVPAQPVRMPTQPSPPRTVKVPEYKPLQLPSSTARKILDRDVLRGVPLPPDVPKLSEASPESAITPSKEMLEPTPTQKEIKKLLGNLRVPDPPTSPVVPSPQKERPQPVNSVPARPSVMAELDELNKRNERLQSELKQMEHVEPPRQVAQVRPLTPAPSPQVTKTSLRSPMTKIQALSGGPGSNLYLQLVQQQISRAWVPPQVDPTVQSFQVIVRFRLYRSGSVKDVTVEQTSGNDYYDLAAKRAVLSARLPEFPAEMSDQYLDAHFSFLVGEQTS